MPLKTATTKPEPTQPSTIKVDVNAGGPIVLTTSAAEFQVRPDGYVQASLLQEDGKKLSLDEPNVGAPADSDFVRARGQGCALHARLPAGTGARSDREDGSRQTGGDSSAAASGHRGRILQRVLALEVYDKFPNILLSTVEYKNTGASECQSLKRA